MEAAAKSGVSREFWHADLKFHRALWAASQNECIQNVLERIVPKLFAFAIIRQGHEDQLQLVDSFELHRLLLDAIAAGDANTASKLMERSMNRVWLDDAQLP